MKISETGVWLNADASAHRFDPGLAKAIIAYLLPRGGSVIDIGCGAGHYVKALQAAGIICDGYDGNPNTPIITDGLCATTDWAAPVQLADSYDWALSLEVGEHIPRLYEHNYIRNLHLHNRCGVILSWAIPGQGGVGHVNERSNDYVKQLFDFLGYANNILAEDTLRAAATVCPWFRDTVMVFEKEGSNGLRDGR